MPGYVDGKFEDCTKVPTNSGQKKYAQGEKKRKRFPPYMYKTSLAPITFLMVPYLIQQDAESDDEE